MMSFREILESEKKMSFFGERTSFFFILTSLIRQSTAKGVFTSLWDTSKPLLVIFLLRQGFKGYLVFLVEVLQLAWVG